MFAFFSSVTPEGVTMMTDISSYLDFILTIFFAFGLAFEVPIATVMLVASGLTTTESLKSKRPYIFLGAFVLGMLLTTTRRNISNSVGRAGLFTLRGGYFHVPLHADCQSEGYRYE